VCLKEAMYYKLPEGTKAADFGINPTDHNFEKYRADIVAALEAYFGEDTVTPGNKAILVHSNTYRVDADVVPSWEFREYFDANNPKYFRSGVRLYSKDGQAITNYPKQHIERGVEKNANTQKRFKRMARILKSLQVEMIEEKILKKKLPSFFIESLVYNVLDDQFGAPSYRDDVWRVLASIFNSTLPGEDCSSWTEVNGVKYLFHSSQPWSKEEAHEFADKAWIYLGFT
jgi:hypothetical protein